MTLNGPEALGRLLARREARIAAATFTKGEHGLFTGSESSGGKSLGPHEGTQKAHREGMGHEEGRIHRAIAEGIQALHGSSVHARTMEFTDGQGRDRHLELSNARETNRPDTPQSEIVPTIQQAAQSPEGMTLDRPIVVSVDGPRGPQGVAVDVRVLPTGGKPKDEENPGMTRDTGGGTAMMGAVVAPGANKTKGKKNQVPVLDQNGNPVLDSNGNPVMADAPPADSPATTPAKGQVPPQFQKKDQPPEAPPKDQQPPNQPPPGQQPPPPQQQAPPEEPVIDEKGKPVIDDNGAPVTAPTAPPPGPPSGGGGGPSPNEVAQDAERDQRIEDLEGTVKELRTELDDIEQLAVDSALADLDQFTADDGSTTDMPQGYVAAVNAKYELPPAFVAAADAALALPEGFAEAAVAPFELPRAFVAGVEERYQLPARQWAPRPAAAPSLTVAARDKAADKGYALPDGSFPIRNKDELAKAITLQSKGNKPTGEVQAHIRKRAKALGVSDEWMREHAPSVMG
jgi:hypothetical protein